MANGGNVKVSGKDGKITLNGSSTIAGSVKCRLPTFLARCHALGLPGTTKVRVCVPLAPLLVTVTVLPFRVTDSTMVLKPLRSRLPFAVQPSLTVTPLPMPLVAARRAVLVTLKE